MGIGALLASRAVAGVHFRQWLGPQVLGKEAACVANDVAWEHVGMFFQVAT